MGARGHGGCTIDKSGHDFNDQALPVGVACRAIFVEQYSL